MLMRKDTRRAIITYDIQNDQRRTKVATTLESYGDRVQYSIFATDIHPVALLRLRKEVRKIISNQEDSTLFCDLELVFHLGETHRSYLGQEHEATDSGPLIVQRVPLTL